MVTAATLGPDVAAVERPALREWTRHCGFNAELAGGKPKGILGLGLDGVVVRSERHEARDCGCARVFDGVLSDFLGRNI